MIAEYDHDMEMPVCICTGTPVLQGAGDKYLQPLMYRVYCNACDWSTVWHLDQQRAIDEWNEAMGGEIVAS